MSKIIKIWYFLLRQLRVIRHSLPSDVLRTLLQAFITYRRNYCNSLLVGLPACHVSRLQSVQNADGSLFWGIFRHVSVEYALHDKLHWLSIMERIKFKVGAFGFTSINGLAPLCLKEFLFQSQASRHWVETDPQSVKFIISSTIKKMPVVDGALQSLDLRYGNHFLWKFVAPVLCQCL